MSEPAPSTSPPPLEEDGPPHILVVDDDPMNLKAMEVALDDLPWQQIRVTSGEEALRELLRREFALILLDVQMPGMDGFEAARLIRKRQRSRDVPIIFVTAFSQDDQTIRQGYELGAVDFLFKPIVPEVLRAKVSALVELHERTLQVARQARQLQTMQIKQAEHRLQEERRKWEAEALRRQNQQLEEADRRKDEFLAVLAHELRNPMAPLSNGLALMAQEPNQSETIEAVRVVMTRQVRHLTRLVDDLLDVSRISRGKLELQLEDADLRTMIQHAIDSLDAHLHEHGQKVLLDGPDEQLVLSVDPVRLTQVFVNLLNNASRYSKDGQDIRVSWGAREGGVYVTVTDEGRGISKDAQSRIFEMFVQEREGGRGLGLGLTLVRELVEMHGGTVSVKSAGPGKGSTFTVELPLSSTTESSRKEGPGEPALPTETRGLRVVVVEDDEDIRETMTALLERWGHEVHAAPDGPSGVELVVRVRPDVAILDIGLPGLSGYGVATEIKKQLGDERPPLVALSGYGQAKDRERSRDAGFDLHFVKPVEPTVLQRILHEVSQKI